MMITELARPGQAASATSFGAYWFGQTISVLGTNVTLVVMPWIVLNQTHSAFSTSATMALEFVPYLVLSVPLGWLTDKWDRKRLMMFTHVTRAGLLASIPLVAWWHPVAMFQLCAVTVGMSIFAILFQSANSAAVPSLVPRHRLSSANQMMQAGVAIGSTFGSPLGGLLMTWTQPVSVLWLDSASYVFAALCLLAVEGDFRSVQPARHTGSRHGMLDGLRFIVRTPLLRANAFVTAVNNFGSQLSFGVLIFFAKQQLRLGSHAVGWVLGAWGIGMLFGSWLAKAMQNRLSIGRIMFLSRMVSCGAQVLFASSSSVSGLILASAVNGVSMSLFNVQATTLKQVMVPDELRGRVASVHQMIGWVTIPLGLIVAGLLVSVVDARGVFVCAAMMQLVSAVAVWKSPLLRYHLNHADNR